MIETQTDLTDLECEKKYCRVAINMPRVQSILVYQVHDLNITPGTLVEAPLGRRKGLGVVVTKQFSSNELTTEEKSYNIKAINGIYDEALCLDDYELEFYKWISQYYHYSLGLLVQDCLPTKTKRPKPLSIQFGLEEIIVEKLGEDQRSIFEAILLQIKTPGPNLQFWRHYIHGVTGSGKSLIYLHLFKEIIKSGKSVLFLLPEINLTPQFVEYFNKFLGCPVFAYHSGIKAGEKYQIWTHLKQTETPIMVLGVRSSIFLPIQNLGLIIVDEEHDSSFKQSDRCPYNGRDLAIKKAQLFNIPIVLGSATPTVENYFNFKKVDGPRSSYYQMRTRIRGVFPKVELVNTKGDQQSQANWPLTPEVILAIEDSLLKKEQVLVFVNRLGFASFVQCCGCGHTFKDPNTDTNLRFFKSKRILKSAYSDYQIPLPDICPECGNMALVQQGFGTEKLQMVLQEVFKNAVIERFDRDEIKNTKQLEQKLNDFHDHKIDIFVGTQMLSKGHNFQRVNKVFILGIDSQLNFPDFRAMERTYQLITQVLGRAGRFSKEAQVFIQTMSPENNIFTHILRHDFESFYEEELKIRELTQLPPLTKISMIYVTAKKREKTAEIANALVSLLCHQISASNNAIAVEVLGPAPAMLEKRTGQFTWNIMLKADNVSHLHRVLDLVHLWQSDQKQVQIKIDVDPYHTY